MKSYILSLDQGTSSSRAILFDTEGNMVAKDQQPVKQYYPIPGHVEQNPFEILETLISAAKNAISAAGIQSSQIASIGITNQRETIILWDKDTGKPVYNAIVWQDRRTSAFCAEMAKSPYANIIREKT
ncbi:MAG: FGGY family carbohydrate kinase, partial [Bacteroidota bacterium]